MSFGTADNRPGRTSLPPGIQITDLIRDTESKIGEEGQIEHAMAAAVSEIEAIPQSLEEVKQRPDWPKWDITIKEELDTLKKAGMWSIVERPKPRNVVKNKWVFRYKKNSAGKVEHYKA